MIELAKNLVRGALRRVDLDLVRTHTTIEGHIARLLKALEVNIVIDVGGHYGEYGELLRSIGYAGRIHSYEPVGRNFAQLKARADRDHLWWAHHFALGPETGQMDINVTGTTDLCSFLSPSAKGQQVFGANAQIKQTERVMVERLDAVIAHAIEGVRLPRVYLKMDTQGYDSQVIAGGTLALQRVVVGIQTEVAVQPLYEGMPQFPECIRPFLDLGFETTGMFAVSRDPRDMIEALEYDLVLRRAAGNPIKPGLGGWDREPFRK